MSRNQDYLQSIETEEGISREDFLKIGDYNRIVYYYKKIPGMEGYITPPGSPFPPAPTPRIPGTPGKPGTPKPPGTPEPPGKPKPPRTPETPHFQPLPLTPAPNEIFEDIQKPLSKFIIKHLNQTDNKFIIYQAEEKEEEFFKISLEHRNLKILGIVPNNLPQEDTKVKVTVNDPKTFLQALIYTSMIEINNVFGDIISDSLGTLASD